MTQKLCFMNSIEAFGCIGGALRSYSGSILLSAFANPRNCFSSVAEVKK